MQPVVVEVIGMIRVITKGAAKQQPAVVIHPQTGASGDTTVVAQPRGRIDIDSRRTPRLDRFVRIGDVVGWLP